MSGLSEGLSPAKNLRESDELPVTELRVERERSRLNIEQLTNLLDGGKEWTERRKKMVKLVLSEPVFKRDDHYFLSTEEAFDRTMEKSVRYIQLRRERGIVEPDLAYFHRAVNDNLPISLHTGAFIPTIEGQGTEEQKAKWLPLANNYEIIGAYAQTEMGHGTFIRGLETTSAYDPSTQEFILNSPTLTSMKWWPGTLGHTATHAVVMARLITKGKDYGVHFFIVQLRSLKDHTPLPGIEVGDIGPKFGYFGMDNGFLRMSNVHIPRDQMLMKYSQVSPDGTYSRPPNAKISYGTMVGIRSWLVGYVARALQQSVTIATRYSVVRRQTQNRPGEPETQVLDYQTQQYKLLPLIATAYAMTFTGQYISKKHTKVSADIAEGNLDTLPELHATSSGLKAFSSEICCQGIELCRLSCGGHGYSRASGIPDIYMTHVPSQTYEGENTVLLLQTARYLLKVFSQRLLVSQLPSDVSYLGNDYPKHSRCSAMTSQQFSDPNILLEAYRQRARRLVEAAGKRFREAVALKMDTVAAMNFSSVDWTTAVKAHCHYVVLNSFLSTIQDATADQCDSNMTVLHNLFSLYGVFGIVQNSGEFGIDDYMSTEQISKARHNLYSLLDIIRQEAVPLVDAFDFHDEVLNSCLGHYDGDVYTHLYQWAQKAPRNKTKVHSTYHNYLKGTLSKSKL